MLLDYKGKPISERERIETPQPATPEAVIAVMDGMAETAEELRPGVGWISWRCEARGHADRA